MTALSPTSIPNDLGPWDYVGGSVYDLGRSDLVAAGVKTYAEAEAHPDIRVQPSVICHMPDIGPYAVRLEQERNDRNGRLIASLPQLVSRNAALEEENRQLRERLLVLEANARKAEVGATEFRNHNYDCPFCAMPGASCVDLDNCPHSPLR